MKRATGLLWLFLQSAGFAATDTTYNPATFQFDADSIAGFGQGISATCAANSVTNLDFALDDDVILTGAILVISGASNGDYIDIQIMNGAVVLATPVQHWYVPSTGNLDYQLVIPKKIFGGLKLRVSVHATGLLASPFVAVNFKLWKVLK